VTATKLDRRTGIASARVACEVIRRDLGIISIP